MAKKDDPGSLAGGSGPPSDPNNTQRSVADAAILGVAAIWGSSYVVMQVVVGEDVSVPGFLALRFLFAILPMMLLALSSVRRINAAEVSTGLLFGFLLFVILTLETSGVQYTTAANAGFLITTSVVIIPLFERVLGGVRHHAFVYGTTAMALVGCAMLTLSSASGIHIRLGDGIILCAALVRGFQIFLFGRQTGNRNLSLVNITLIEFVLVAVLGTIAATVLGDPIWTEALAMSTSSWLLTAYLGLLGTAYAFFVQLYAAKLSSSTRVGLILSTEPVFAALFAVLLVGDQLGVWQIFGGALIVIAAAVGRVVEGRRYKPEGTV